MISHFYLQEENSSQDHTLLRIAWKLKPFSFNNCIWILLFMVHHMQLNNHITKKLYTEDVTVELEGEG
ncbi:hypothetical protein ACJX0J_020828, partial [Zea mays]